MKIQDIFPAFNHPAHYDRPPSRARLRVLAGDTSHLAKTDTLDLATDGADEVLPGSLTPITGLGGALLSKRIVAAAARRFIVAVDASKVGDRFSSWAPVPVEVVPFGHELVAGRPTRLGLRPVLRLDGNGAPVLTDGGNLLYDCHDVAAGTDPAALADDIRRLAGVIDSGIFVGMANVAIVARSPTHIERLGPKA